MEPGAERRQAVYEAVNAMRAETKETTAKKYGYIFVAGFRLILFRLSNLLTCKGFTVMYGLPSDDRRRPHFR